jgi:hypothetical protein
VLKLQLGADQSNARLLLVLWARQKALVALPVYGGLHRTWQLDPALTLPQSLASMPPTVSTCKALQGTILVQPNSLGSEKQPSFKLHRS